MTLTITNIMSAIKRHLSIIGKRLYGKDGKNLFADITLSSAEDTEILKQYITHSAQDVESVLKQFITESTYTDTTITMDITNTRGDSDFETRTQAMVETYTVLNTTGEYLSMVHPDLAQKYFRDAQQRMESLIGYVYYKKPPTETTSQSGGTTQPPITGEQDPNIGEHTTDPAEQITP